jgi:CheY-like chemotaxis protein
MPPSSKKVLAAVTDVFFSVKINETAKRFGLQVEFVKTTEDLMAKVPENPVLLIIDLNASAFDAISIISKLKGSQETKPISIIGFLSHAQGELKQQAHQAGADMVLPKSTFSVSLPQILRRHSGSVS